LSLFSYERYHGTDENFPENATKTGVRKLKVVSSRNQIVDRYSWIFWTSIATWLAADAKLRTRGFFYSIHNLLPESFKKDMAIAKEYLIEQYRMHWPVKDENQIKWCVVPLAHFTSYYTYHKDRKYEEKHGFREKSTFLEMATNIDEYSFFNKGDTISHIILKYKWESFARKRFYLICFIYLTLYLSYTVGVSFSREVFNYSLGSPITDHGQIACVCLIFISMLILLIQEIRQFTKERSKLHFLLSPYNWIDFAAVVLPTLVFVAMIQDHYYFVSNVCFHVHIHVHNYSIIRTY
jgi:hypothetical protein